MHKLTESQQTDTGFRDLDISQTWEKRPCPGRGLTIHIASNYAAGCNWSGVDAASVCFPTI